MAQIFKESYYIPGIEDSKRVDSRILEERIQEAIEKGHRILEIEAHGQHGIGGRLWKAKSEKVKVYITGAPGQRVGCMGFPNTIIEVFGNVSDDVGWLNAGAEIIVHGHAGNGAGHAMAQGKILVAGNIGARGMNMTKHNPRFDPPELWVLGSVGDYFAEFMAGGIAVVCGYNPQNPNNILGHRPCVGMVGGKIFFRGNYAGHSQVDVKLITISEKDWEWLKENLKYFLKRINKEELYDELTVYDDWKLLVAKTPQERRQKSLKSMLDFSKNVWEKELGAGGLIGDIVDYDRGPIPLIVTGDLRRYIPVWENEKYAAPCEFACPTGIPVHKRWGLIRDGRIEEAVDISLLYSPFPATICGYLCPHLCMQNCTKVEKGMAPVDVSILGKLSQDAKTPELPPLKSQRVAVIGGGPGGISVAWHLRFLGYQATIFDKNAEIGGKIYEVIPKTRIPKEILETEIKRVRQVITDVVQKEVTKEDINSFLNDYDFVVVASGANKPRTLPVPGAEKAITALEFLRKSKQDKIDVPEKVVVIGAGNVGCDVATEAYRLGAKEVILIDIQEPASFGEEREKAIELGAKFKWPVFTKEITDKGVVLENGETIDAGMVVIAIGDQPDLSFLPENINIEIEKGFIKVNEYYKTSHPKIFAIGDVVKLGLITDAVGAGRIVALAIDAILNNKEPDIKRKEVIDKNRIKLEYFNPRILSYNSADQCAEECASCGTCRDCGICITICPQSAISRIEKNNKFELVVDDAKCIGCGFCVDVCPCGVWTLKENSPMF